MTSKLQLSVISSFHSYGVLHPTESIPPDVAKCLAACPLVEVYVMMENESTEWANVLGFGVPPTSAMDFMAQVTGEHIAKIAGRLVANLTTIQPSPQVIALATFFPEIAHEPGSAFAEKGIAAIRNTMKLAKALQDLGHPTHVVEVVAGSLIRGIGSSNGKRYEATFTSISGGQNALIANLQKVMSADAVMTDGVYLAVEAEPGPIFLLNDNATIKGFARAVSSGSLFQRVGLNLDISHWRVAKISVDLLNDPIVRPLILHAHIGGHHQKAHLGDTNPIWMNTAGDFTPWLNALRGLPRSGCESFGYRGIVSLEYEAARRSDDVLAAIDFFRPLM